MGHAEFTVERERTSNRSGAVRWVLSHVLRHRLPIVGLLIGAAGNAALAGATPVLAGRAFDAISSSPPDLQALGLAALLIALSQIARGGLFQLARNFSSETLGQRVERDVRDELYASLLGKSMSFHDSHATGDLMARATNDVREINLMFNPGVNLVVGSLNFLLVPLVTAPSYAPELVLAPLVYLLLYGLLVWHYLSRLRPRAERVRESFGAMNEMLAEAIEGIETVKGAAKEEGESRRFAERVGRWRDAYVAQTDIEAFFLPLLLLGVLHAAGLLHSLLLYRAGRIGVGSVVAYNGLLHLFRFPTFATQFAYTRVSTGLASARRLFRLITTETVLDENEQGYDETLRGDVRFEDVCFSYETDGQPDEEVEGCRVHDPAETALEHVSFTVQAGQTVALVGQTGSGKSTVAKLISRIYDVNGGRVRVDGVDVREWNLAALRRQISIIEQDIFLFSRSIAENIAFGCPGASEVEIEAAARQAQAHDFIERLQDGYDTVVGERGATLSGGQRQRVALARAFLTDPAVLILDDATSAIDSETEDRIQQAIERAAQDRTTFLITHRLSQIRWADLIIVMKAGRVEAIGTHEELMASSKTYSAIFAPAA